MDRKRLVMIDLSRVSDTRMLHSVLSEALEFPGWYGGNWDAFWDAITGLVALPVELKFTGWASFEQRFPHDANIMRQCFSEMAEQYPAEASLVTYL